MLLLLEDNMRQYNIKYQQGATLLLTLVFMIGMLGMIGLAIDTGHVLVNKTRLQNALDAAALSAAIRQNGDIKNPIADSIAAGIDTFDLFIEATGNAELSKLTLTEDNFKFSEKVRPFVANGAGPFVQVSFNALPVTHFFIQAVTKDPSHNVGAVSTAGPMGQNCKIVPFVLCAADEDPIAEGVQMDTDCKTDSPADADSYIDCYGYNLNEEFGIHKRESCDKSLPVAEYDACIDAGLEAGNFELLTVADSPSGADIKASLAGDVDSCTVAEDSLKLAPGFKVGPVSQGIDLRISRDTVTTAYSAEEYYDPDHNAEDAYEDDQLTPDNLEGKKNMRVMTVPIGDCDGIQKGLTSIKAAVGAEDAVARMCVLVKRPSEKAPDNTIYIEILEVCSDSGNADPNNAVIYGPFKIVLFKSQGSGDS